MQDKLEVIALRGFPMVEPGDDLVSLISACLEENNLALQQGDVVALAQKIVSKAEDRYRFLDEVTPGQRATQLAAEVDKDPRLVELILSESTEVVRQRLGVLIVEHKLGLVHANAGIDQSNIIMSDERPRALLLPEDPDQSARALKQGLDSNWDTQVAVLINDSAGRAWRNGTSGIAIGVAGFTALDDLIGQHDMFGQELRVTTVGVADELAAAASYMMGQAAEARPVVIVRGANIKPNAEASASDLVRPKEMDLFR